VQQASNRQAVFVVPLAPKGTKKKYSSLKKKKKNSFAFAQAVK
jgi:hypothetical protein